MDILQNEMIDQDDYQICNYDDDDELELKSNTSHESQEFPQIREDYKVHSNLDFQSFDDIKLSTGFKILPNSQKKVNTTHNNQCNDNNNNNNSSCILNKSYAKALNPVSLTVENSNSINNSTTDLNSTELTTDIPNNITEDDEISSLQSDTSSSSEIKIDGVDMGYDTKKEKCIEISNLKIKNYHCAHACMQGHRDHMEDDYAVGHYLHYNLYAVFDGHCGFRASNLASKKLFKHFKSIAKEFNLPCKGYNQQEISSRLSDANSTSIETSSCDSSMSIKSSENDNVKKPLKEKLSKKVSRSFSISRRKFNKTENYRMEKVMIKSLEAMDNELYDTFTLTDDEIYDGTTCIWLVHDTINDKFHIANLGDSRCLISIGNQKIFMTKDHKPSDDNEMDRIYDNGGFVMNDRVNANLALSRALGDFEYKERPYKSQNVLGYKGDIVSRVPDVSHVDLIDYENIMNTLVSVKDNENNNNDNTMTSTTTTTTLQKQKLPINILLACDGVFDVYDDPEDEDSNTNENMYNFLNRNYFKECDHSTQDLSNLIHKCLNDVEVNNLEEEIRLENACRDVMLSAFDLGSTDNISVMLINLR